MVRKKPPSKKSKTPTGGANGRDPATGRFNPGYTANPSGRPPKTKTVDAAIARAFAEKAAVRVNGRQQRVSKLDIAATQLANRSAAGDPRVAKLGFELARKAEESKSKAAEGPATLNESDQQIAERLFARWRKILMENSNGNDGPATP
jgi:hypothetical protein